MSCPVCHHEPHTAKCPTLCAVFEREESPKHGGARDGAGRPPKGADARSVRVPVFLTVAEVAHLDEQRGALTRSEWLARPVRGSSGTP